MNCKKKVAQALLKCTSESRFQCCNFQTSKWDFEKWENDTFNVSHKKKKSQFVFYLNYYCTACFWVLLEKPAILIHSCKKEKSFFHWITGCFLKVRSSNFCPHTLLSEKSSFSPAESTFFLWWSFFSPSFQVFIKYICNNFHWMGWNFCCPPFQNLPHSNQIPFIETDASAFSWTSKK